MAHILIAFATEPKFLTTTLPLIHTCKLFLDAYCILKELL
jgi:hypothetical protein